MEIEEKNLVTATELKQNFGKYLALVEGQDEVVISKNGAKVARLIPYISDFQQYLTVCEKALTQQYGGRKVSYEEFMEIYSNSDIRMEYIDGEIHLLASPNVSHQRIIGQLYLILHSYLSDSNCEVFMAPFDVHFKKKDIKDPDVMQPDLLVACDLAENVTDDDHYMGTPTLVFEILSNSTRTKDMITKLNTYRLSGVKEYWLVDPRQENIIVYNFRDCEIERYKTYDAGSIALSVVFQGLEVPVSPLFAS